MNEFVLSQSYKSRRIAAYLFVVVCLIFLLSLPSLILSKPTAHAASIADSNVSGDPAKGASPNVITDGLFSSADGIHKAVVTSQRLLYNGSNAVRSSLATVSIQSVHFIAHTSAAAATALGHAAGAGINAAGDIAGGAASLAGNVSKVGAIITPASENTAPPPTIPEDLSKKIASSGQALPANSVLPNPQPQVSSAPQWPIRGYITLEFGVPHWPFQPKHTGIDISDGAPSGVTPVHPFKSGVVIESNYNSGFGNHVIIDNGGGLTSLYGHMALLLVKVGQKVDDSTILGLEGNTGASEGVHVHFQIEVNGVPVNPRLFVSGQP